jgi:DNA-binding response OmpR family regulator
MVVEDEPALADAIGRGLRREGFVVDIAADGGEALEKSSYTDYDVVVLDRDLPVVHGDEVCRRLSESGSIARILMLTAAGGLDDRVHGLGLGADDYLAKPFEFDELVARVHALGRRLGKPSPAVFSRSGILLDPGRRIVIRDDRRIELTPKEFGVLEELMRADGRVLSAEVLLERVWDENADPFTNAVRITVSALRKRLGEPWIIVTVPGVGYRIVPPEAGERG